MNLKLALLLILTVGLLTSSPLLAGEQPTSPHQAPDRYSVRGSVVDEQGLPLAGSNIELAPVRTAFDILQDPLQRRPRPLPITSVTSGDDGRFVLTAPGAGLWQIFVTAHGRVSLRAFLVPVVGDLELPPALLPRDAGASLLVVDAQGEPVPDAGVWAGSATRSLWESMNTATWRPAPRLVWTDDSGRAQIPRLVGEALKVEAWSPGGDTAASANMVDEATLALPTPGPRRIVEARDAAGQPIAGVLVAAGARTWPLGLTDHQGRHHVPVIDGRPSAVLFAADGGHRAMPAPDTDKEVTTTILPGTVRVSGRVVDAAARPVSGALIWAAHHAPGFAVTAGDGAFALRLPAREEIRLEARAPGMLPASQRVAPASTTTLELEAAAQMLGSVVDTQGNPMTKARIEARSIASFGSATSSWWAAADADGHFRFDTLKPGESYHLIAFAGPDQSQQLQARASHSAATELTLVVKAGRAAFGVVRDLDGNPLPGIEVRLHSVTGEEFAAPDRPRMSAEPEVVDGLQVCDGHQVALAVAQTNEQGRFEVPDVPASLVDVEASGPGWAPLIVRGLRMPKASQPVDLGAFLLEPGVMLEGRVLDPDGNPLTGAKVWKVKEGARAPKGSRDPATLANTSSDDDGHFVLEDLVPEQLIGLHIEHEAFLPASLPAFRVPAQEPVIVRLRRGVVVRGRVIDTAGEGIEDAELHGRIGGPTADLLATTQSTTSDSDGGFELGPVAPGELWVDAVAKGYQPAVEQRYLLQEGETSESAIFVLERGSVLEGRVTDERGNSIAGARVLASGHSATTAEEGTYRLDGLAPGPNRIEVRHDAYSSVERTVEINHESQNADFELTGGRRIAGRTIDPAGLPVVGVEIELESFASGSQLHIYTLRSGTDGNFSRQGVADGRYKLSARHGGHTTAHRELHIDGADLEDLELMLEVGAMISGRIVGLDFEQLSGVKVRASRGDQQLVGTVDYEGGYRVVDASPGDWLVIAQMPGGDRQAQTRVTIHDSDVERDLEFGAGITLTGEVVYGETFLTGAAITLAGQDVAMRRTVRSDLDGRFQVADLAPGAYRLTVNKPSLRLVHNRDLELFADHDMTVEIDTARLIGAVRSADTEEPLDDALIMLHQLIGAEGDGSLFTASSDLGGQFTLERLTAGRYQLQVRRDGYQPLTRDLDVPSEGVLELPLNLQRAPGLDVMARLTSGRAPRLLTVVAMGPAGPAIRATRVPDAEGFVRFPSFPEGTWELLLSAPGSALVRTEVTVPGEPLPAVLPDAGAVHVRIPALVESDALAALSVRGTNLEPFQRLETNGELRVSWTVVGGRATVDGLPAGAWTLDAQAGDGRSWSATVVTTGGPGIEVELRPQASVQQAQDS